MSPARRFRTNNLPPQTITNQIGYSIIIILPLIWCGCCFISNSESNSNETSSSSSSFVFVLVSALHQVSLPNPFQFSSAFSSKMTLTGGLRRFSSKVSPFSAGHEEQEDKEKGENDDRRLFRKVWFPTNTSRMLINEKDRKKKKTKKKNSNIQDDQRKQPQNMDLVVSKKKKSRDPFTIDDNNIFIFKQVQLAEPIEQQQEPKVQKKRIDGKVSSYSNNSSSLLSKLQGVFSRSSNESQQTLNTNKNNLINNSSFSNGLSSIQKAFAMDRFMTANEEWITVFPKTRIMPGQMVPVTVAGLDLLVVASRDGRRLYCIANSCPHLGTPLEIGALVRLPRQENTTSVVSFASSFSPPSLKPSLPSSTNPIKSFTETDISNLLSQDGCEDCIVCPLHRTAFALESGEVRGPWCPYPPILGKVVGTIKAPVGAAVFGVRTKGKNVQVRINTVLPPSSN